MMKLTTIRRRQADIQFKIPLRGANALAEFLLKDKLVKRSNEAPRWLEKKVDIQGVVFLTGSRPYMRYVEGLSKIYNEGDQPFYDAILKDNRRILKVLKE